MNDKVSAPEYDSGRILVRHHQGQFCARCWNFDNNAIKQEGEDEYLCPRCNEVIHHE